MYFTLSFTLFTIFVAFFILTLYTISYLRFIRYTTKFIDDLIMYRLSMDERTLSTKIVSYKEFIFDNTAIKASNFLIDGLFVEII